MEKVVFNPTPKSVNPPLAVRVPCAKLPLEALEVEIRGLYLDDISTLCWGKEATDDLPTGWHVFDDARRETLEALFTDLPREANVPTSRWQARVPSLGKAAEDASSETSHW